MAYERRRLSTESDRSSTSTNSTGDKQLPSKRTLAMNNSPAEILLARTKNTFMDLNPYFQCSSLPSHWRKNKSLRFIIRTKSQVHIQPNTRAVILAGNDYNPSAMLKNNTSWFRDGQAEFNDLRFLAASGRGKKFTLSIIIETTPPQQCTYRRAIKITVDGPRKKREMKVKSDVGDMQGEESNFEPESDNDTRTTSTSMKIESQPVVGQGSSGLLLLAAAAEQKRKDEEEEPMSISYASNCLSPSSSLATQFSHSIAFSPLSSPRTSRQPFLPNHFLGLTATPNRFDFHHNQPTIVATSATTTASSSTPASNSHVLCR